MFCHRSCHKSGINCHKSEIIWKTLITVLGVHMVSVMLETLAFFCNFMENKFVVMEQNKIILYQDDNEITRVAVRFAYEDLWLTQN